jgi:uncharacterized protein with PIN domain
MLHVIRSLKVMDLALCPNCKRDLQGVYVIKENIEGGAFKPLTTMYSCPNCQVILGFSQFTNW